MSAEFLIEEIHNLGVLLALKGEVKKGEIVEGDVGSTWENKRFNIIDITTKDGSIRRASSPQKVTLMVRNLLPTDVRTGDIVYIE